MQQEVIEGFRISPQQKQLWEWQQRDSSLHFHAQCTVLIEGILSNEVLRTAIQRVVDRNEILRTTFQRLPGMSHPVQVVSPCVTPQIDEFDLRGLSSHERDEKIELLQKVVFRQPFRLSEGPLLRLSLATLSAESYLLMICLPAFCADVVGLGNLVREISLSCTSPPCIDAHDVDETLQYADLSEWQNDLLESEEGTIGRKYWQQQVLFALNSLKLPFQRETGITGFEPQEPPSSRVEPELVARIASFARQHETSPSVFLLACWSILVGRLVGKSEIIIGTAFDCRTYRELEDALGHLRSFCQYVVI